ncbi:TIR domain-containing protein [Maritalea sp.]|uniref:TIR domain-containing protein n=1 Tax=Maritalea sp. TaxID=2003361 RepID=UPI003EF3D606
MFNLLISSGEDSWQNGTYEMPHSRVAIEYTVDQISERYKSLNPEAIEELKSFPCIFVVENEPIPSKIGYISDVRIRSETVVIHFEFDPIIPELPVGAIEALKSEIDLGRWELSRTHWAIKDESLFEILVRRNYVNQQQVEASFLRRNPPSASSSEDGGGKKIFIVHGHDDLAKLEASKFVSDLGLEPIILHQQASAGMTIIEKIEHYSGEGVGFGIVLYTPCDTGAKVGALTASYRARQNVVFEHGYLIAKLGRSNVTALVKGNIETPNDISGVVYVSLDHEGNWKTELLRELRGAGYQV